MDLIKAPQETYKASDNNKFSHRITSTQKIKPKIIYSGRSRSLIRAGTATYLGRWILDYLEENPRSFVKDISEAISRKANSDISKWYFEQVDLANQGKGSKKLTFG